MLSLLDNEPTLLEIDEVGIGGFVLATVPLIKGCVAATGIRFIASLLLLLLTIDVFSVVENVVLSLLADLSLSWYSSSISLRTAWLRRRNSCSFSASTRDSSELIYCNHNNKQSNMGLN